ncbi:MAG: nucleoside triphosphate pyrophosphohydrolase [Oscillospiraceae bacterium]|jgi:tetrapyrrole methylase family protein/MazG family protein
MLDFPQKDRYTLYDMVQMVSLLRSRDGCPWDREQTHESIRRNFLEEAYEAVEAIDQKDSAHLREELGDVLMQVLFHSDIEREAGSFDIEDVADAAVRKLLERHPHVFGEVKVSGSGEVLENWDAIKRRQNNQLTHASAMDSVARSLPSLWRAEKIQNKARKAGFDWPDIGGALDKIEEELCELREAVKKGEGVDEEVGDLLFSVVNVSRFTGTDPEQALGAACDKFIKRFSIAEKLASERKLDMTEMTLDDLDKLWDESKRLINEETCSAF